MKQFRKQIGGALIVAERVRHIAGGFSFVPHRFLLDGFLGSLTLSELGLYFLLIVAGDRNGVSFYGVESICNLLCLDREAYLLARNGLINKDLIAFDGRRYQVLSLPREPQLPVSGPLTRTRTVIRDARLAASPAKSECAMPRTSRSSARR